MLRFFTLAVSLFFSLTALAAKEAKTVSIYHIEALSEKDTIYSNRFQKNYEGSISTGTKLTADRLKKCGYTLDVKTSFFAANDPLQAKEMATQAEKENAWLIVGPARSNHYLLLAQGAPNTPSVSAIASSDEVAALGNLHISMSPTNSQMAKIAAKEARARSKKGAHYVSIISEDCISCRDFAKHFDLAAKKFGLKKSTEILVAGEYPETANLFKTVSELKPDFVLLPNYSKTSSHLMAALSSIDSKLFFVGGDGWGDARFGFVQNAEGINRAKGFTVRGYPPTEIGLMNFKIGKNAVKESKTNSEVIIPGSGSALGQLLMTEMATDILCQYKPKDRTAFRKVFEKTANKLMATPWGVSIYDLKDGNITFTKSERL